MNVNGNSQGRNLDCSILPVIAQLIRNGEIVHVHAFGRSRGKIVLGQLHRILARFCLRILFHRVSRQRDIFGNCIHSIRKLLRNVLRCCGNICRRNMHQLMRLPIVGQIRRCGWRDRYGKLAGQNFQLSLRKICAGDIIRGYCCFFPLILEYRCPCHLHCAIRHIGYFLLFRCCITLESNLVIRVAVYLNRKLSRVLLAIIGEFILRNFNVHAQQNFQRPGGGGITIVVRHIHLTAINNLHNLHLRSDRILTRLGNGAIRHAQLQVKRMTRNQGLRLRISYVCQIFIVAIGGIVIYLQRARVKRDFAQRTRNDGILLLGRQTVIFAYTGDRDGDFRAGIVPVRFILRNCIVRFFCKGIPSFVLDAGAPRFAVR